MEAPNGDAAEARPTANARKGGIRPHTVAAAAYGLAAACTGIGVLGLTGDGLDVRAVREVAPLAVLLGAAVGFASVKAWPTTAAAGVSAGIRSALAVLIVFSLVYLAGDLVIELARGGQAGPALNDAAGRLWARLPLAVLLAAVSFAGAGALLWVLGRRRAELQVQGDTGNDPRP